MEVLSKMGKSLVGRPVTHEANRVALDAAESGDFQPFLLETSAHDGGYAVSFPLGIPLSFANKSPQVIVDMEVREGSVGVGCVSDDLSAFTDVEHVVSVCPRRKIYVGVGALGAATHLMIRNARADGASVVYVHGIEVLDTEYEYDPLFGDLDELGQATAKDAPLPFLFCVVSWGCAATQWLANTLNAHPDIYCVHCANQFWERLAGARSLDGWAYLRILGCESPASRACGDVHGVSRETIPDLRHKLGERFNCAILVREPLARLRSQMALFETFPVKSAWNVDGVRKFTDNGVRLPHDTIVNRLFLHGANMLNNILLEEPLAPVWRSEDLTTNGMMLVRFIEELTRGHVQPELEWAERVARRAPSNRHRAHNAKPREFEHWQIEAVKKIVEPRAWELYENLGYNTPDFVR
jgi:hypothetical protein